MCLALDHVLYPTTFMALNRCFDPYQRLDRCGDPVGHEFKFAIRWNERDCAIIFESSQADALMELDILHLDSLATRCYGEIGIRERDL